MKRIRVLSALMALLLAAAPLAACKGNEGGTETQAETAGESTPDTTPGTTPDTEPTHETDLPTEPETDPVTDPADETMPIEPETKPEPKPVVVPDGEWGKSIANATEIANTITAYYTEGARTGYHMENMGLSFDYPFTTPGSRLPTALKNASGAAILDRAMDVYVTGTDGERYYASASTADARPNIFRYGYYYYDVRIVDQNFGAAFSVTDETDLHADTLPFKGRSVTDLKIEGGKITYTIKSDTSCIYTSSAGTLFSASEYNAVSITVKTTGSTSGRVYVLAGGHSNYSDTQSQSFALENNGAFNTYVVPLTAIADYTGDVKGIRVEIYGENGDVVEITSIKAAAAESLIPDVVLDHTFHLYADKLNSVAHVVAKSACTGVAAIGQETRIPADRVAALVVCDASGLHDSLDDVDFATAEYVGFDLKDSGVLGFILLPDVTSGTLEVTLENGEYIVSQERTPAGGRLAANEAFFLGQRVYVDESHDLDAFVTEAEFERHPLPDVGGNCFRSYDALRGAYTCALGSAGFNEPYFTQWNRHFTGTLSLTNAAGTDRKVYVLTTSTSGCLENAVLLNDKNLLLPIQLEVAKNFGGEKEEPTYNPGDVSYGESLFPLVLSAGQTLDMTILNLYQNWGNYPLKQLSSIQYIAPYYHLSTGVTETSCIAPWYVNGRSLWTLPDFRPMSAPFWFEMTGEYYGNQPQHTHGGYQYFLEYTDADGNYAASENRSNVITSSGPVYASVDMSYISDDGRIRVTYTQTEMPQTDEHRVYYEMKYEVLEDIEIADFRNDFDFYSAYAYAGRYKTIGYLDENNAFATADTVSTKRASFIKLGMDHPYFALYHYQENSHNGFIDNGNNTNLGCSILDWDLTVGGAKYEGNLLLMLVNSGAKLTLDLDRVTLKKGDTMTINMIIGPWGWQESDDDSNVREIRAHSTLDPLTVTVTNGEKIDSTFLPKVMSTDGKSAEFTLSGGRNNSVVRVYGMAKLTAPVVYEKVNGQWVEYILSSVNNPDRSGYAHSYDGYAVYYEGDGTYSYAFVTDMTDGPRTFRVDCSQDFTAWPEEQKQEKVLPLLGYSDAKDLDVAVASCGHISAHEVKKENGVEFVRVFGNGTAPEAYTNVWSNPDGKESGQYIAVRYRLPKDGDRVPVFEIFTSTTNGGATADDCFDAPVVQDGTWHVIVLDAEGLGKTFDAVNNRCYARYIRLDFFNTRVSTAGYVDLAFVGIDKDLKAICDLCKDLNTITYRKGDGTIVQLDTATGKEYEAPAEPAPIVFGAGVDMINGIGDNGATTYASRGGGSARGTDVFDFNNTTIGGSWLVISGWSMVEGGAEKYVFSVDGGKTWGDMTPYGMSAIGSSPSDAIVSTAASKAGIGTWGDRQASRLNSVYQGPQKSATQAYGANAQGVGADLSAYAGQTVTVLFAAVPVRDPEMRCVIAEIRGVEVIG